MPVRRTLAALVAVAAVLGGTGALARAQSSDTLAVDVSVDEATDQLAAAEANVDELRGQLAVMRLERAEFSRRLEQRDARHQQAADELRHARTMARDLAIAAYMGAGSAPTSDTLVLAGADPMDYVFQSTLVTDSTNARFQAADYYRQLRDQASDAVEATVEHLDELDDAIVLTELALGEAEDAQRTAAVVLAEAEEAAAAARQAAEVVPPGSGEPPPDGYVPLGQWPGGPSYEQWAALRNCESGGNYRAVSPSGLYRGAYQFDLGTWATVGGSGDPINASPAEQDHRAQVLWSQRGSAPWPVCGQYLH
jgi:hypothetical protein